ncbi:MAG: hypothetical protein ABR508_04420 [Candidatus Baltobacteraceae bacterium]
MNTFAHPYATQLVALWLSFIPVAGVAGIMIAALVRGDRGSARLGHIRVPSGE